MLRHTAGPVRPNCFGHSTTRRSALRLWQIAGFAFAFCIATPALAGTWTQVGTLPTPRSNASVAVLPNGLVLVAGGVIGATALTSAELDDPATGIFTVTGSLATARQRATATMLANGKVLIAGGTNTRRSIGKQVLKFQMPTHVCSDERTLRHDLFAACPNRFKHRTHEGRPDAASFEFAWNFRMQQGDHGARTLIVDKCHATFQRHLVTIQGLVVMH
jgi:hypothetical protein